MRYTVFDVETPNAANDRMSAVGVAVVEDGKIVERFYSLVDPQTHFDAFNISLTGITPQMAAAAPSFPAVWQRIAPLLEQGIPVAHNAPFDMSVLGKCLRDYGLFWRERTEYLCTCRMARQLLPHLGNHRLDTLCRYYGITLQHHRADSDAEACAKLLIALGGTAADSGFLRTYDLGRLRTLPPCRR